MNLKSLSIGIFLLFFSTLAFAADPYVEFSRLSDVMEIHVNSTQYNPTGLGTTRTEVNFGDGTQTVVNSTDLYHKYSQSGQYTVTVKVWNILNAQSTYSKVVDVNPSYRIWDIANSAVFSKSPANNLNYSFSLTSAQADKLYKIKISRLPNSPETTSIIGALLGSCNLNLNIKINGVLQIGNSEIDCNTQNYEKIVKLSTSNEIVFQEALLSQNRKLFKTEITAVNLIKDYTAPVLSSNITSGSLTNNQALTITIDDQSSVNTIVKDGSQNILFNTSAKQFLVPLVEGINNFEFQSTDAASNTSEVYRVTDVRADRTPAVLNSILNSEYIYGTYPQNFTLIINSDEDLQYLAVNGVPALYVGPRTYQYTLRVEQPGQVNINIFGIDLAGNESHKNYSPQFNIDNIAPNIQSSIAVNAHTSVNTFSISVTDNAETTTEVFDLLGTLILSTHEKNFSIQMQQQGLNSYIVKSHDYYNNEALNLRLDIFYDSLPPVVSTSIANNANTNADSFHVLVDDISSTDTEIYNDETNQLVTASANKDIVVNFYQQGLNRFRIKSKDDLNNIATEKIVSFTFDSIAPKLTSSLGNSGLTNNSHTRIVVEDVAGTTTQVIKDSEVILTTASKSFDVNFYQQGTNQFTIKSVDSFGNHSDEMHLTFTYDSVAPTISSSLLTGSETKDAKFSITITDTSSVTTTVVDETGLQIITTESPQFDIPLVKQGTSTFKISAEDAAGNVSLEKTISIYFDSIAPVVSANLNSSILTNLTSSTISIQDASTISADVYSVEGELLFSSSNKTFPINFTKQGLNSFIVKVKDSVGNLAEDFHVDVNFDSISPTVTSSLANGARTSATATSISVSDVNTTLTEVFNSAGNLIQSSSGTSFSIAFENQGTNNYVIKSRDAAGNYSPNLTLDIYFDSIKPTIATNIQSGSITSSTKFIVQVTDQSDVTTEVYDDQNNLVKSSGSSQFEVNFAKQGINLFKVVSKDEVGNQSVESNLSFDFDNIKPVISSNLANNSKTNQNTIHFSVVDASATNTGIFKSTGELIKSTTEKEIDVDLYQQGENSFVVKSTDAAGNVATNLMLNVSHDSIAPVISTSIANNSFTNESKFSVLISDQNSTTTKVFDSSNTLLITSVNKNVEILFSNEGVNSYKIESTDEFGNVTRLDSYSVTYDSIAPAITSNVKSSYIFSTLPQSINFEFSASEVINNVLVNGDRVESSDGLHFNLTKAITTEGSYSFLVEASDLANNSVTKQFNFNVSLDNSAPVLWLSETPVTTNKTALLVSFKVSELNKSVTSIYVNGQLLANVIEKNFSYLIPFTAEGANLIEVFSTDEVGNRSPTISRTIVRDTTAPVLADLYPSNGSGTDRVNIPVSGKSNEPLENILVNGTPLKLSSDGKSFSGTYISSSQGDVSLVWEATDLAGNSAGFITHTIVAPRLLIPELVSVGTDPEQGYLRIIGVAGSTRPGTEVTVTTGFFSLNRGTTTSNVDGSFMLRLESFSTADLVAKDLSNSESSAMVLSSSSNSAISGLVKDTDNNPIQGVVVSINGSTNSVLTDSSGVFSLQTNLTGDRELTLDGSTALIASGTAKKYTKTKIAVNIGLNQANVIERPIYLNPLYLDGSQTQVAVATGAVVESLHAPGAKLEIPSQSVQFPTGATSGSINIAFVQSSRSTIPVPEGFVPTNILSMEPSGTKFSKPVQITLPNDNELPPKTPMVIISLNSSSGKWELDGYAAVTDDGQSVKTNNDSGITHFSSAFAIPISPLIGNISNPNLGGIEISAGGFDASITAPSFKILGKDITPTLRYNSGWANPTAVVTKSFIVDNTSEITSGTGHGQPSPKPYSFLYHWCRDYVIVDFGPFGQWTGRECGNTWVPRVYETSYDFNWNSNSFWVPDEISSQFFVDKFSYDQVSIQNSAITSQIALIGQDVPNSVATNLLKQSGIPTAGVISYALELRDPDTGTYLDSGIHSSAVRFQIKLKNLIITTVSGKQYVNDHDQSNSGTWYSHVLNPSTTIDTSALNYMPHDSLQNILVQNKTKSKAGRGWNIGHVAKIYNPSNQNVMLENADGTVSTYSVNNTISTLFSAGSSTTLDFASTVDLTNWPYAYLSAKDSQQNSNLSKINLADTTPTPTVDFQLPTITGKLSSQGYHNCTEELYCDDVGCYPKYSGSFKSTLYDFKAQFTLGGLIRVPSGEFFILDKMQHSLYRQNGQTKLMGKTENLDEKFSTQVFYEGGDRFYKKYLSVNASAISTLCNNTFGNTCGAGVPTTATFNCASANLNRTCTIGPPPLQQIKCTVSQHPNFFYTASVGSLGKSGSELTSLSSPSNIVGFGTSSLLIADTGNNRILRYNLSDGTVSVFAGNGQNADVGNNILAPQASIFHPLAIAVDSSSNVYISSESGYIRKVDTSGNITFIAGKPLQNGGSSADEGPALLMAMNFPSGLLIDNDNNYLYVADTNFHRVIRIDLNDGMASKIAGTGACTSDDVGDGNPALKGSLCSPTSLGFDDQKNLLITDSGHKRIRRVVFSAYQSGAVVYHSNTYEKTRLFKNSNGTWTRQFKNGTYESFDSTGRQVRTIDRSNQVTQYEYNSDGDLEKIIYPNTQTGINGDSLKFNYLNGKLSSIVDPANRETKFHFNGDELQSVDLPDSGTKSFQYDLKGRLVKEVNQLGYTTELEYNAYGRLEKIIHPDGTFNQVYDLASQSIATQNSDGYLTPMKKIGFNGTDASVKLIDENGNLTQIIQDAFGYPATIMDAKGNQTKIKRNYFGQPTKITRPDQTTVEYEYDQNSYDLISIKDTSTGVSSTISYDTYGNQTSFRDGRNYLTNYEYDSSGRLSKITHPDGEVETIDYDGVLIKKRTSTKASATNYVIYNYNAKGQLISKIDNLGKHVDFLNDDAGNVIKITTITSGTNTAENVFTYDAYNRIKSVTNSNSGTTNYIYNYLGDLLEVRNSKGIVKSYQYDTRGRAVQTTNSQGQSYFYEYDAYGNRVVERSPNNITKNFQYDVLNRLVKVTLPDDTIVYDYDVNSRLIAANDNQSELTYSYDSLGRVIRTSLEGKGTISNYPLFDLNYGYDNNGNRTNLTSSLSSINYQYDARNRVTKVLSNISGSYQYLYDDLGRVKQIQRGSNLATNYLFEANGNLSSIDHFSGSTKIDFESLQYDARNIISNRADWMGVKALTLDGEGQLLGVSSTVQAANESYSYDEVGNRKTESGNSNLVYESDLQKLKEDSSYFYSYDLNGNVVSKVSKDLNGVSYYFTYNSKDQLVKVTNKKSLLVSGETEFKYDVLGRRIYKRARDLTVPNDNRERNYSRYYVYDQNKIFIEFDAQTPIPLAYYTVGARGSDDLLGMFVTSAGVFYKLANSSDSYFFLKDHLGSVTSIANSSGAVVQRYNYSAFGTILSITDGLGTDISSSLAVNNRFTYTGREYDREIELYYYRARYYDSKNGRFIQADPAAGVLSDPLSVTNKYSYAFNSPQSYVDPTGKYGESVIEIGGPKSNPSYGGNPDGGGSCCKTGSSGGGGSRDSQTGHVVTSTLNGSTQVQLETLNRAIDFVKPFIPAIANTEFRYSNELDSDTTGIAYLNGGKPYILINSKKFNDSTLKDKYILTELLDTVYHEGIHVQEGYLGKALNIYSDIITSTGLFGPSRHDLIHLKAIRFVEQYGTEFTDGPSPALKGP